MSAHLERSGRFHLDAPVGKVFPLLTPIGEKDWVEGWNPEFLHPADGRTEAGMVFRTGHGGETTLWACADFDPDRHRARYCRVVPGSRMGFVTVACRAEAPDRTEVEVTYAMTALAGDAAEALAGLDEAAYARMLDEWQAGIGRLLAARGGAGRTGTSAS